MSNPIRQKIQPVSFNQDLEEPLLKKGEEFTLFVQIKEEEWQEDITPVTVQAHPEEPLIDEVTQNDIDISHYYF